MTALREFERLYRRQADCESFLLYGICPIRAHSDHLLRKIMGFTIDKGIHIYYEPNDSGRVEVSSMQFLGKAVL